MAWSRLAKKFRDEEPAPTPSPTNEKVSKAQLKKLAAKQAAAKQASQRQAAAAPAPEPVPEPVVEAAPAVPAGPPKPSKRTREVVKRQRFVYVPPKAEEKAPAPKLAPLGTGRGNSLAGKMMTKNIIPLPEEDPTPGVFGPNRP